MGNTIEQYAGLKLVAAYPFSGKTFSIFQKSQNRHFLENEQYGRLESWLRQDWSIQAARSRASWTLSGSRIQGYQGSLKWSKAVN